ncbi:MAG: DNA polymerase III subunit delta [Clostridia bacterium]|nr:DNA polymerase III subunit delta [Clostridia bacterium]
MSKNMITAMQFLNLENFGSVYILTGDDVYLRESVVKHALGTIDESIRDLNYNVFDGDKSVIDDVIAAANTLPAFAERRIVFLKRLSGVIDGEHAKSLEKYMKDPNESSILILADDGNAFLKFKKFAEEIDASTLKESEVVDFIKRRAKELGSSITHDAAKTLATYANLELMRIESELKKLSMLCLGETVDKETVEECVSARVEYRIFDIANAVADKKYGEAMKIIEKLQKDGVRASEIISQLSGVFRKMLYVRLAPSSTDELSKALGVKPYALNYTKKSAMNYSPVALKRIYDEINEKEFQFKSGVMSEETALGAILVKIFS